MGFILDGSLKNCFFFFWLILEKIVIVQHERDVILELIIYFTSS